MYIHGYGKILESVLYVRSYTILCMHIYKYVRISVATTYIYASIVKAYFHC